MSAPVRYVTVEKFGDFSGYSPDAVRSKIKRGDWLEGAVWVKAPDGRVVDRVQDSQRKRLVRNDCADVWS